MKLEGKKLVKTSDKWRIEELLQYFRLTIDYRIINSQTIPLAGAMPFQFLVLENVRGAKYDHTKGFWQLPLEKYSQELLSFMLGYRIMTPTRVMQGHCDSALFFQNTMVECFKDLLYKNVLIWFDDILVWANTIDEYVSVMRAVFDVCIKFRLQSLTPTERRNPTRIQALCKFPYPTDAGQLQQFICTVNWIRDSLIGFAHTIDRLQKRLTEALMCLFTDASAYGWSIVVIQVHDYGDDIPIQNQQHQLLYLLLRPKRFLMHCDHKNLIRVFAPHEELKAHTREKLIRWADMIGQTEHQKYVRALGEWAKKKKQPWQVYKPSPPKLRSLDDTDFVWPDLDAIRHAQVHSTYTKPNGHDYRGLLEVHVRIWIPDDANDLFTRRCIVAHCGSMGHRGHQAMAAHMPKLFYIRELDAKLTAWMKTCLLCPHTRDDLTHYCRLIPCDSPTSQVAVEAIMEWSALFGVPEVWISDGGSYFKNSIMKELATRLRAQHNIVLAYCPWRNGTVERVNRDILGLMRIMPRETKLKETEWDYLLPVVQANINQTPVATLDHTSPMECFTGLEPTTALNTIVGKVNVRLSKTSFHTIDWKQKKLRQAVEEVRRSLQEVHSTIVDKQHAAENKRMLEKTNQNEIKVTEGDFVLWSRVDENTHYPKLLVTWIGHFRVLKCLPYLCVIEHLITGVQREAHHSRLKFYAKSHFHVTEEIIDHVSEQGTILVVDQIEDARRNPGSNQWELLIRWKVLESLEASWEQLSAMHQEIPSLVQSFADQLPNGAQREELVEALERL
ncbi:hypothetical protein H257_09055 [Aphanomyces astaci]|uniref:Integrase catalytic domain-containing protein n=1 Tax=Aphanomyces astaci TaxID=112090 RepID=W4GDN2_APHAT|nr:hypothetical protein H257_09055 [Aphanomyces astaci]ETV77169.1 hypothetical protein H257_09055 [Aphanomyces astaci]|eukprot:XP_009833475.1 hypothetical protein H257_09055 [Aphanomyces astaci]